MGKSRASNQSRLLLLQHSGKSNESDVSEPGWGHRVAFTAQVLEFVGGKQRTAGSDGTGRRSAPRKSRRNKTRILPGADRCLFPIGRTHSRALEGLGRRRPRLGRNREVLFPASDGIEPLMRSADGVKRCL